MNPIPTPALPPHTRLPAALASPPVGLALTPPPLRSPSTVNTAVFPEIRPSAAADPQPQLPLATEGVLRYVWDSKFGPMLIEVVGDQVFVNGGLVERTGG